MRLLMLAIGLAAAAPVSAQAPAPERWAISDGQVAFVPARVAFPLRPATLTAVRHEEFSAVGRHIDNGIQYRSSDGRLSEPSTSTGPACRMPDLRQ